MGFRVLLALALAVGLCAPALAEDGSDASSGLGMPNPYAPPGGDSYGLNPYDTNDDFGAPDPYDSDDVLGSFGRHRARGRAGAIGAFDDDAANPYEPGAQDGSGDDAAKWGLSNPYAPNDGPRRAAGSNSGDYGMPSNPYAPPVSAKADSGGARASGGSAAAGTRGAKPVPTNPALPSGAAFNDPLSPPNPQSGGVGAGGLSADKTARAGGSGRGEAGGSASSALGFDPYDPKSILGQKRPAPGANPTGLDGAALGLPGALPAGRIGPDGSTALNAPAAQQGAPPNALDPSGNLASPGSRSNSASRSQGSSLNSSIGPDSVGPLTPGASTQ